MTDSSEPLDAAFREMLACPATRKPLREVATADLASLNEQIARGGVHNRGGAAVSEPLEAGLQPEDEAVVYPVQGGIPILLTTEAIPLDPSAEASE